MSESPAEKFARAKARQRYREVDDFAEALSFPLDDFQREACEAVKDGHSVLVAAPTGAGKTLVGEYAVYHAAMRSEKAFYTTPIKALSNQKYNELKARYGPERVGLLTGDTSINSNADIVVMTTEVLRNMIYAGSETLERLGVVVLDEVHYLADRYRGSVWEEVIVHLDTRTAIVALSATVSNAEEFGAWLGEVRGDTRVIVSERRPVPLWPHVLMREGIYDLYASNVDPQNPGLKPALNPELEALVKRDRYAGSRGRQAPRRTPPRFAVIDVLDDHGLLPAIYFIFSRVGCEAAVDQLRSAGTVLTTSAEQSQIASIIDERCANVPVEDLAALDYYRWRNHLEAGIAAHHAGMMPLFKETVEELFAKGLVKVVFATETLALGINMPARSVVLDKLVKWDGRGHKELSAGEYTQLTGRAGRRGIDIEGHAVVVEHQNFDPFHLARLASRRTYPLVSSFHPSYNMSINLVSTAGAERARAVLEMSFAQYQADQSVVGKARNARELTHALEGYRHAAVCDRGDVVEYAGIRQKISKLEKESKREGQRQKRQSAMDVLADVRRGDIVSVTTGKRAGKVVVVAPDHRQDNPRPTVVNSAGRSFRLAYIDVHQGMEIVGTMRVNPKFDVRDARARRELGMQLAQQRTSSAGAVAERQTRPAGTEERLQELRIALRTHPCHQCPDREEHMRWTERYFRALRDRDRISTDIERATGAIARIFDRRIEVLTNHGYLELVGPDDYRLTESGEMLKALYSENDMVIAEALRQGIWSELNPAQLAATVSTVLYQGRKEDEGLQIKIPGGQSGELAQALKATTRIWSDLDDLHEDRGLPEIQAPHWGIVGPIFAWTQGKSLSQVLKDSDLAPGDMVRWCKQVIDALDQIAGVAPDPKVRNSAIKAITSIRRGVVAY